MLSSSWYNHEKGFHDISHEGNVKNIKTTLAIRKGQWILQFFMLQGMGQSND